MRDVLDTKSCVLFIPRFDFQVNRLGSDWSDTGCNKYSRLVRFSFGSLIGLVIFFNVVISTTQEHNSVSIGMFFKHFYELLIGVINHVMSLIKVWLNYDIS